MIQLPEAKEKAPEVCTPEAVTNLDDSTLQMTQQVKDEFSRAFAESAKRVPANGEWDTAMTFDPTDRKRAWWFLMYPESMNPNALQILSESGYQGAVSPLHDRDRFPDGTPKKEHYHVLVYVSGKVTEKTLRPLMDAVNGVRLQPVGSVVGACRYLPHMDIDPEHIPSDRGKVHYSPDEIVTFGGFDVQSFIKATQTQVAKALREMYSYVEAEGITSYYGFVCWMYETHPEYDYLMSNPQVTAQLDRFIRSKFAVLHRNDELNVVKSRLEAQAKLVDKAIASADTFRDIASDLIQAFKEAVDNG